MIPWGTSAINNLNTTYHLNKKMLATLAPMWRCRCCPSDDLSKHHIFGVHFAQLHIMGKDYSTKELLNYSWYCISGVVIRNVYSIQLLSVLPPGTLRHFDSASSFRKQVILMWSSSIHSLVFVYYLREIWPAWKWTSSLTTRRYWSGAVCYAT